LLAAILLAQNDLGKLDAAGAHRLPLAAELIEAGMTPRELAREFGLHLPADLIKYDPDQPRVPAGKWASFAAISAGFGLIQAKDKDVTGGTIPATLEAKKRVGA
jgi:hypothetical protein